MRFKRSTLYRSLASATMAVAMAVSLPSVANADIFYGENIGGKILDEFYEAARVNGRTPEDFFGPAVTREADAKYMNGYPGRWQAFSQPSSIYWHRDVSGGRANQIGGALRDRWGSMGHENGKLGYPTSRESPTRTSGFSGITGRFNSFQGGSMYYTQNWGARVVWGDIYRQWAGQDYEQGAAGFPQGDEVNCYDDVPDPIKGSSKYGGWGQRFEGRWIWHNTPGVNTLGYTAVDSGRTMAFDGSTKYQAAFDRATSFWNSLGRVDIHRDTAFELADINLGDYSDPAATAIAYYSPNNGDDVIRFNDAKLSSSSGQTMLYYVATHELGHALGLDHSCQTQLMDPFVSSGTNDNDVRLGELDRLSYEMKWS